MPRPPLPVGSWGVITREELGERRWQARTRFRDHDGRTRQVTAIDASGPKAERKLIKKLTERSKSISTGITPDTRLELVAQTWIAEIEADDHHRQQTIDRYVGVYRHDILPALGGLTLRELNVSTVDRFLKGIAVERPGQATSVKQVLSLIMALAVRHDAIEYNPVKSVGRLRSVTKEVRALDDNGLDRVFEALDRWNKGLNVDGTRRLGPGSNGVISDVITLMLASGKRINEVLAILESNVDLSVSPVTVKIEATLVNLKGVGIVRQEAPKTDGSLHTVLMPKFGAEVLRRRIEETETNALGALFVTRNGTWVSAHNVRRVWRAIRTEVGLEWVVPHTFRKTVATTIEREYGNARAADQLGHANLNAIGSYVEKKRIVADSTQLLEKLGPRARPDTAS